jgi:hypothetical protein
MEKYNFFLGGGLIEKVPGEHHHITGTQGTSTKTGGKIRNTTKSN